MNRRRADTIVAILLGFVLLAGSILGWRAYRRRRAVEQSMGAMMGGTTAGRFPFSVSATPAVNSPTRSSNAAENGLNRPNERDKGSTDRNDSRPTAVAAGPKC